MKATFDLIGPFLRPNMPLNNICSGINSMLVACDGSLLPIVHSMVHPETRDTAEHVDTFQAASELAANKHFDVVLVEIFFDGGLRLFDLLRLIRNSNSRNARIICFRGAPSRVSGTEGVCDDAVAYAAKVIAGAEYWDLSSERKRLVARRDIFGHLHPQETE